MHERPDAVNLERMRELLTGGVDVRIKPGGISMLPTLRPDQDVVILSPLPENLKKYDVPFYIRDDGQLVLHRIVKVGQTYTCIGDNQFLEEPGVRKEQMIGMMSGFVRNGKEHSVDEAGYCLYCRLWHGTRKFRHVLKFPVYYLRRALSCLISKS